MPVKEKKLTGKQIARVLEKARKLMNDNGKHWNKGEYKCDLWNADETRVIGFMYCARGAIREALAIQHPSIVQEAIDIFGYPRAWSEPDEDLSEAPQRELDVLKVLHKVINNKSIEGWNDHPKRTWAQVDEKFRKAAELARESG